MEKEAFDPRDMTILIVDDEPRIRDFVSMNLELERYRVIEASNGLEALEQLRANLPDLIVMDVMMPEIDGFETLRHIREVSNIPVIMILGLMITSQNLLIQVNCSRVFVRCCAVRSWPLLRVKRRSSSILILRLISPGMK